MSPSSPNKTDHRISQLEHSTFTLTNLFYMIKYLTDIFLHSFYKENKIYQIPMDI